MKKDSPEYDLTEIPIRLKQIEPKPKNQVFRTILFCCLCIGIGLLVCFFLL